MDKIQKALKKLNPKERAIIKTTLLKLQNNQLQGLDIQKLQGRKDIFRFRKGDLRIILRRLGNNTLIMAIERRSEKTYRNL
ncbi:MAG: hypothetical protein AAB351_02040 [Patescibacteria group bacterium]